MQKFSILVACFLIGVGLDVLAQKPEYSTYLDAQFQETVKRHATFVRELTHKHDNIYSAKVIELENGKVKMEGAFNVVPNKVTEHGIFTFYYPNGAVESRGEYDMGLKIGTWKRFAQDGTERPDRYYDPSSAQVIRDKTGR